jgi:SAM-dependent methyltransferase
MDEVVETGYARIARRYHEHRLGKEAVNEAWLDGLRPLLPQSGTVVDLGCGAGVPISRYFARRGYDVFGYDLSPAMLEIARAEVPEASFERARMQDVQLPPGSVDLVTSFFAIIHVEREIHPELFRRMFAWLREGGAALLTLGANDNPEEQDPDWLGAPMAWSHFDADTNLDLLREAGFEIAWHEVEEYAPEERHLFVIARKA